MLDLTKYGLGNGDGFTSRYPSGLTIEEIRDKRQAGNELKENIGETKWLTRDFYGWEEFDAEDLNLLARNKTLWDPRDPRKEPTKTYPVTGNFKQAKTRERKEIYRILIEKGADLNVRDDNGETPLTYALQDEEALEIVRILLETGSTLGDPTQSEKNSTNISCSKKAKQQKRSDRSGFRSVRNEPTATD